MTDAAVLRSGSDAYRTEDESGQTWEKWPEWELSPPPEGHPDVGTWAWGKFEVMRRHRDNLGLPEIWLHFHELYRNRIFRLKSKYTQVPANLYFKTCNTFKANLTDNKPRASIMPRGNTADEIADGWQAMYDYWWDTTRQQSNLQESVGKSVLYGYQTDYMGFNPELNSGIGEIECVRLDTFGFLTWPGYMDHQLAPMCCRFEAMELGNIYRTWEGTEDKIKADPEYSELLGQSRVTVRGNRSKQLRPIGAPAGFYQVEDEDRGSTQPSDVSRALVVELWVRDFTMLWIDPRSGEEVPEGAQLEPDPPQPIVIPNPQQGQPQPPQPGQAMMAPQPPPGPQAPGGPPMPGQPPQQPGAMGQQQPPQMPGQPLMDTQTGQPIMIQPPAPEPVQQSKYPGFIRCIRVTDSGKTVLDDMPNPSINPEVPREITCETYLWDHFPFIKRLSYSDDISEYGLSIMEQIEPLITEISKKLTMYGVHLDVQCKAPLILPQGCGVKRQQVNNLPGRIWEPVLSFAAHIKFLQPPAVSGDVVAYINLLIQLLDAITGLTDVSEGRRPGGTDASGVAIANLQEKAQTIFREMIRNLDLYLEEQGRMFISLGQNWYTHPQMLRYEGKQQTEIMEFKGVEYQGDVAFNVEAGSTLPRNRAVRHQAMLELAKGKMLTMETLFKELGIPNGDEEAAKLKAGPIGLAIQKLQKTGMFNPQVLQAIQKILAMPEPEFKKSFPQAKGGFEPPAH